MNTSRLYPRENQIAELTRGLTLPLGPVADEHLDVIFEKISYAWSSLSAENSSSLQQGSEAEVNAMLGARLNHLCETDLIWSQLVKCVARGVETVNFDGRRLETRPDLSIMLTNRHSSFPIIIECKIIDYAASKGTNLYCGSGLIRFVSGDYAWANRESIMLAYVRDGSLLDKKLTPYLSNSMNSPPDMFKTFQLPQQGSFNSTVYVTKHDREFFYLPAAEGQGPGPISVHHLWLT